MEFYKQSTIPTLEAELTAEEIEQIQAAIGDDGTYYFWIGETQFLLDSSGMNEVEEPTELDSLQLITIAYDPNFHSYTTATRFLHERMNLLSGI